MRNLKKRLRKKLHQVEIGIFGSLYPRSNQFKSLFPKNAKLEKLQTGFHFTEGPVWVDDGAYLLFSDIPANTIYKLNSRGEISVFRHPSNNSNGLAIDKYGHLLACEHGTRRVTRTESDGTISIIMDQYNGCRLNSPNDIVIRSDGTIYFTDPPYGINKKQQLLTFQGIFCISNQGRNVFVAAKDFNRPNGLAFSPDEKVLYVDDTTQGHIRAFDVAPDGRLHNSRLFHQMISNKPGVADGMTTNSNGEVFCTGPGGIWVFDPDGQHLGTIATPEQASNCCWGDHDKRSLLITAESSIYRVRLETPGFR